MKCPYQGCQAAISPQAVQSLCKDHFDKYSYFLVRDMEGMKFPLAAVYIINMSLRDVWESLLSRMQQGKWTSQNDMLII